MVIPFDEAAAMLDEIADGFPEEFYQNLNGAVLLLREEKKHPGASDLSIMGTYCRDNLGRYIELYYGSFRRLAKLEDWTRDEWYEELRRTLAHEFTHHLESLAGERALEVKDEVFMEEYWAGRHGEKTP